ncbi:hypothetical protein QBC39DRAFT_258306 [Podospora conica]|nr:hypothetical protein QBC39DRAFT_258306 [Schizothecium conicum]
MAPPPARASRSRPVPTTTTTSSSSSRKRKHPSEPDPHFDDLFGPSASASNDLEVIDLVDTDVAPAPPPPPPPPKNEIRLSAFQCVICMDDVTNLTVTHCGHLFCNECLHSSLHVDMSKRICPICRQKIDQRPAAGAWGKTAKGYYPLELKLATKKSLGKRAAAVDDAGF